MVALFAASIFKFFIEHFWSGLWSGCLNVFALAIPYVFSFHSFIRIYGGSWLGSRDLPAIRAVFCLFYLRLARVEAHMGITGTHLPPKRVIWLMSFMPKSVIRFLFEFVHNLRY